MRDIVTGGYRNRMIGGSSKEEWNMYFQRHRKEIVIFMDLFIIVCVYCFLFQLLPESNGIGDSNLIYLLPSLIVLMVCDTIAQYLFKTYSSIWRYAQSKEYLMLLWAGAFGFITFLSIDQFLLQSNISLRFFVVAHVIVLFGMLFMRLCYRYYCRAKIKVSALGRIPVLIIGADNLGVRLLEETMNNPNSRYLAIGIIDDSIEKIGKSIHNVPVNGPISSLNQILMSTPAKEVIVDRSCISTENFNRIIEVCRKGNIRVRIIPDTFYLLQKDTYNLWDNVRDLWIDEVLGREQIFFDYDEIREFIDHKVILVTGGGGSIGSELCRQIAKFDPKELIILDFYENNVYELQQELKQLYGDRLSFQIEIASIQDKDKINYIFEKYRPNIVFHAAAHKHVPLMESCPEEAVKNNVFGTYHVVMAADRYEVDKFVLISTDKAVNPTNIMGASKRFCEMILQSMRNRSKTEYVAVRFGNVLGSNGSVIPLFQNQIAHGGPVTITDMRIERFFMTIGESTQLVLQAGAMANRSEIYVLDMGQPIKIIELAENLIRLSGYAPYVDIKIIETGLRPGEKLFEELLMSSEELIGTENHKIFIERQKEISKEEIEYKLEILQQAVEGKSVNGVKEAMKSVVSTYRDPEEVNEGIGMERKRE